MQEVLVRQEKQGDAEAIAVVNRSAFGGDEEAQLVAALRGSESFIPELSLVAVVGERIAGHILLFRARLERPAGQIMDILALAPMAWCLRSLIVELVLLSFKKQLREPAIWATRRSW